jgi:phage FluMu protein Com
MKCPRCQGLMVKEFFADDPDTFYSGPKEAFRCIACGHILDRVIFKNQYGKLPEVRKTRPPSHNGSKDPKQKKAVHP